MLKGKVASFENILITVYCDDKATDNRYLIKLCSGFDKNWHKSERRDRKSSFESQVFKESSSVNYQISLLDLSKLFTVVFVLINDNIRIITGELFHYYQLSLYSDSFA